MRKILCSSNMSISLPEWNTSPATGIFMTFPSTAGMKKNFTPLKRVDRNVYHYLNTLATAYLCGVCGDPEEERYRKEAEEIKKDILEKTVGRRKWFFMTCIIRQMKKHM